MPTHRSTAAHPHSCHGHAAAFPGAFPPDGAYRGQVGTSRHPASAPTLLRRTSLAAFAATLLTWTTVAAAGVGCWSSPALESDDIRAATTPFAVLRVRARDAAGRDRGLDVVPRRPILEVEFSGPCSPEVADAIFLIDIDNLDETTTIEEDLRDHPLRREHRERAEPATLSFADNAATALLVPENALEPGARYVLAIGAWATGVAGRRIDEPSIIPISVATGDLAGASFLASLPADGTAGVAPNLPLIALHFDAPVFGTTEGFALMGPAGPTAVLIDVLPCARLAFDVGFCLAIRPTVRLTPSADHSLRILSSLTDGTGAPVGPITISFRTAAKNDRQVPVFLTEPCGLDEQSLEIGCALVDDDAVQLRVRTDEPVRLWFSVPDREVRAVAPRGEANLILQRLGPDNGIDAELVAEDQAGNRITRRLPFRTTPPLAPLSIVEVRADPRGPEPRQEYVEILNFGSAEVDLAGFALADAIDRSGDVVTQRFVLPGAARALFVATGFTPDHPDDAPVPPGTALVTLDGSLASGGIGNSGEALYLRDPLGRRVSAAPALPPQGPGGCIVRTAMDFRSGARENFAATAVDGCTPGRPPRPTAR